MVQKGWGLKWSHWMVEGDPLHLQHIQGKGPSLPH